MYTEISHFPTDLTRAGYNLTKSNQSRGWMSSGNETRLAGKSPIWFGGFPLFPCYQCSKTLCHFLALVCELCYSSIYWSIKFPNQS